MSDSKDRMSYLAIGQIVGPHGIRGEVKVQPLTDYPERFKTGAQVYIGDGTDGVDVQAREIAASRPNQNQFLVLFAGVKDRNAAEALRWKYVLIPETEAMPLGEHENYLHDLIGLAVETTDGQSLGMLKEILLTAANDVYVVRGEGGEVLVPATRDVVVRVDLEAHVMIVALPEGLLKTAEPDSEDEESASY